MLAPFFRACPILLLAAVSACSGSGLSGTSPFNAMFLKAGDTPLMAQLRRQAEETAAAARKNRDEQNAYDQELKRYNELRNQTSAGNEATYREYEALLARYTAVITFFLPVNPGDEDPHLPVVAYPAGPVTPDMMKRDYEIMADDYLSVARSLATGVNYSIPPDPPPLPPIPSGDKDARRLATLEQSLVPAMQRTLASRARSRHTLSAGWGPDVPLGGLHTHPGPAPQDNGGWCQVDSRGTLVPCN